MDFDCSLVTDGTACQSNAGISKFNFTTGKAHRLRLINAGGSATQKFTIDNHEMIVIANDFVPVQPYRTSVVTLGVGQRSDVIVKANGRPTDAVWMRSEFDLNCFPGDAQIPQQHLGQTLTVPTNPLLLLANLGNVSYPEDPQWNVYNFGKNTSIRVILRNYFPAVHPMHLHGHDFWVLAEGVGTWDGRTTNPHNPQRRDTQLMVPGSPDNPSYVVLEWNADNPGVWPLHCHTVIHSSAGLLINVLERPDLIIERQIPAVMAQTCRDWARYTESNVVNQIDSGL
ncbi:MAG: hypothetical protein Q9187_004603 [Circinaria calcarea]